MKGGTKPHRIKLRERDYLRSFHPELFGGTRTLAQELKIKIGAPQFPDEFLTDKTGWYPNQNAADQPPPASRIAQPTGCTNYSTVKQALILGFSKATVDALEAVTHASANGGYGVLASVDDARTKLGWFKWRYIIQTTGVLDFFDTFRLAQVSGLPEQRAIAIGTPWFDSWEQAALADVKIMPMPTAAELAQAHSNPNSLEWHDYIGDGWSKNFTEAPGTLLYRLESHQGCTIDNLYLNQATLNVVLDLFGTVAVTVTNNMAPVAGRMPLPDWFWNLWHSWLGFSY